MSAFEITSDDVANIMQLSASNPKVEAAFDALDDEDFGRIEKDALKGEDLDDQTNIAYETLRDILDEKGLLG